MKTVLAIAAAAGLASTAMGQIILPVGNLSLVPGSPVVLNFNVPENVDITEFSFSGDNTFLSPTAGSWGSDTRMTIQAPGGASASIGGYDNILTSTFEWDFQGSSSSTTGARASGPHAFAFGNSNGQWTLTFENDFNFAGSQIDWENVTVTLVPAPGAAALLGMGGLLCFRRRR
jgi:hypothetical protein